MNRKLVITKLDNHILTSILEDEEVVELHCSKTGEEKTTMLGNIYVGKVKNIVSNIGAAFIEIADGKECYYAIEENKTPIFTHKIGKKPLCIGDELLVQVSKEAVKTKVPTVSSKLELSGKYAVLTSGDTRIGASGKLPKAERERLIQIAKKFENASYGIIVRTNAKDVSEEVLCAEISALVAEYEAILIAGKTRVCYSCLKAAPKPYLAELKNVYQDGLTEIVVEDLEIHKEVKDFLEMNQPEDIQKLRLYKDALLPLHKLYCIEKQVEDALKECVWMKSGAYLVIQHTEALTVIDVNTGKSIDKKRQESVYFKIDMEAAKEVAKQIRLRNLSGIILIDFINLSDSARTEELLAYLERELSKDPIATTLVDMTKLQLVEVTRKKIRKPFYEAFRE
ncbi:MAG: ribonuclease E/G [Faecalimonas sp.]|nr:ribonuclease E/G [Faecalimonas sp.]